GGSGFFRKGDHRRCGHDSAKTSHPYDIADEDRRLAVRQAVWRIPDVEFDPHRPRRLLIEVPADGIQRVAAVLQAGDDDDLHEVVILLQELHGGDADDAAWNLAQGIDPRTVRQLQNVGCTAFYPEKRVQPQGDAVDSGGVGIDRQ